VSFSEPVINVDAGDLLVNGQPAQGLTGSAGGPYLFTFAEPAQGTVTLSWTNGHAISDLASNAFVGTSWTLTLNSNSVLGNVVINEFLSANVSASGLRDEDLQYSDWIELYNRGGTPVNLAGWSLSDDPRQSGPMDLSRHQYRCRPIPDCLRLPPRIGVSRARAFTPTSSSPTTENTSACLDRSCRARR
jgi:hypothetical protein